MSNKQLAIKRINKDMREITQNPIEGIGIASIDDNPMRYVINMRLMTGPYEGYCVQLLLMFSDNYPTKPPKILIYPNQAINGQYHHHIFDDSTVDENNGHFKKFCIDLLDNDFMNTTDEKTGWNPSYSISSILLQVQNFIADPDMHGYIPDEYLIDQLMKSMDTYTRTFTITNEKGEKEQKIHTWKAPYPEMFLKPSEKNEEDIKEKEFNDEEAEEQKLQQIKENLTCFMLKVNYIDDPNILLGYPIIRTSNQIGRKNRLELYPIPELLTYDGFLAQKSLQGYMVQQYFNFKSANNEYYNSWLPIYINKDHYEKNKKTILKSIAEITGNMQFNQNQIFQVLPVILNSMIIGMYKGKTTLSSSFINCYFQYILLFKKLCQEYSVEYSVYLNDIFNQIKDNNYSVNKNIIPDIGNFFIVLLFNKVDINSDALKKIYNALFKDFIVRQMFWMFHSDETKNDMKKLVLYNKTNEYYLENFEKDKNFFMNNLAKFNEDIHAKNIYKEIIDTISTDKGYIDHIFIGKEKAREQVEKRIKQSFKRLFLECSQEGRNKLKDIILNNLDFKNYFPNLKVNQKEEDLYENFQVHEILKNLKEKKVIKEFLEFAFDSQRGNQLLIITFFAQKKVEENNFLDELEKNYGVYLDVDNFINGMNDKLDEIETYKQLFEYVGADFIKEKKGTEYKYKTDLDLIIKAYEKALEKNYIRINRRPSLGNSMRSNLESSYTSRNPLIYSNYSNYSQGQNRYRRDYRHRHHRQHHSRSRSRSRSYSGSH